MNIVEMYVVSRGLLPAAAAPAVSVLTKYMFTLPGQLPTPGDKKKQDKQCAYHITLQLICMNVVAVEIQ